MVAYNRISALAGEFLNTYIVDPKTGRYREFASSTKFDSVARPSEGMDFFGDSRINIRALIYPEDLNRFLDTFTKEKIMADIENNGIFTLSYRLMIDGLPRYVQLKAALLKEAEGDRLIFGVHDIDYQVRQEEIYARNLAQAQKKASIDALTGVKNKHAYLIAEDRLNSQITDGLSPKFAIVILDLNDLKKVNDTLGHDAGDQYIKDACKIICDVFKHSPVFRIGGDEFAVIAQGDDFANTDKLMTMVVDHNEEAHTKGGIIIACGMARYNQESNVAHVFDRADQIMYRNKSDLKNKKMLP